LLWWNAGFEEASIAGFEEMRWEVGGERRETREGRDAVGGG